MLFPSVHIWSSTARILPCVWYTANLLSYTKEALQAHGSGREVCGLRSSASRRRSTSAPDPDGPTSLKTPYRTSCSLFAEPWGFNSCRPARHTHNATHSHSGSRNLPAVGGLLPRQAPPGWARCREAGGARVQGVCSPAVPALSLPPPPPAHPDCTRRAALPPHAVAMGPALDPANPAATCANVTEGTIDMPSNSEPVAMVEASGAPACRAALYTSCSGGLAFLTAAALHSWRCTARRLRASRRRPASGRAAGRCVASAASPVRRADPAPCHAGTRNSTCSGGEFNSSYALGNITGDLEGAPCGSRCSALPRLQPGIARACAHCLPIAPSITAALSPPSFRRLLLHTRRGGDLLCA